jgi:hypothetical protein
MVHSYFGNLPGLTPRLWRRTIAQVHHSCTGDVRLYHSASFNIERERERELTLNYARLNFQCQSENYSVRVNH